MAQRNPFSTGADDSASDPYAEKNILTPGARSLVNDFQRADAAGADPYKAEFTRLTQQKTQLGYAKQAVEQLRDKFLDTEGADLFHRDPMTGKLLQNPDKTFMPKMGAELDGLRKKAGERVGTIRGALTTLVAGEFTPDALEAQKRLAEVEPIYKAKIDKWERIQEQIARVQKASDENEMSLGQLAAISLQRQGVLDLSQPTPATTAAAPAAPAAPAAAQPAPAAPQPSAALPAVPGQAAQPGMMPEEGPITPLLLVKLHRQMKDAEEVAAMPTTGENMRKALLQKKDRLAEMFGRGMAALPSDGLRQRVVDITRDPTALEYAKNFLGRIGEGAGGGLVDMGEFVARNALRVAGNDPAAQAGAKEFADAMREEAASWGLEGVPKEVAENLGESFSGQLGQGLGSTLSFMVPTTAALRIGKLMGASDKALKGVALATAGVAGGAQTGNSMRREAEIRFTEMVKNGEITAEEARRGVNQAEVIGALIVGPTEAISPVQRWAKKIAGVPAGQTFLKKLGEAAGGGVESATKWLRGEGRRYLVDIISEAGEESAQELVQGTLENMAARGDFGNVAYDPTRDVGEGTAEGAAVGGITGALFSALFGLTGGNDAARQRRIADAVQRGNKVRQNGEQPPPQPGAPAQPAQPPPATASAPQAEQEPAAQPAPATQSFTFFDASGKEVTIEGTGLRDAQSKLPAGFVPDMRKTRIATTSGGADESAQGATPDNSSQKPVPSAPPAGVVDDELSPEDAKEQLPDGNEAQVSYWQKNGARYSRLQLEAEKLEGKKKRTTEEQARLAELNKQIGAIEDEVTSLGDGEPEGETSPVAGEQIDEEWTAFSQESGTLGIPRADMPQVKAEHRGALTQFLKGRGVESTEEEILPGGLKPTQAEFSPAKVEKARKFDGQGDRAILISSDGYVVDGHHQWVQKLEDAPDSPIRVIRLNAPIKDVLETVKQFPSAKASSGATESTSQPAAPASGQKDVGASRNQPQAPTVAAGKPPSNGQKQTLPTESGQAPQVGGAKPAPANTGAGKAPSIARGKNTPATFLNTAVRAAGLKKGDRASKFLTDFSGRMSKMNPKAFAEMEVYELTDEEWKRHESLGSRTPDSAGAYDSSTNTLYINTTKSRGEEIVNTIVHEAGHFAEKFALGEDFTQREWEKLTPDQRVAAFQQYTGNAVVSGGSGDLTNNKRARAEWVAMQFARVVRGETDGLSKGMMVRLQKFLEQVRALVNKWIGDGKLTTKELDAKILDILDYRNAAQGTNERQEEIRKLFPNEIQPGDSISTIINDDDSFTHTIKRGKKYISFRDFGDRLVNEQDLPSQHRLVGKNSEGQNVYEDAKGARHVEQVPNILVSEPVGLVPTRAPGGGIQYVPEVRTAEQRKDTPFETVEEREARKPKPVEVVKGENAIEARIYQRLDFGKPDGFNVVVVDTDSDESVGVRTNIKTIEGARRAARELLTGKKEQPPAPPAAPPPSKPEVSDELRKLGQDLFGTPAAGGFNQKFDPAKLETANKFVGLLVREHPEVRSRAALAAFIAKNFPKARPYSDAVFRIMGGFTDLDESGTFTEAYAAVDNPAGATDNAPQNEQPAQPPATQGNAPQRERQDPVVVGGQQSQPGQDVGGRREPDQPAAGSGGRGGQGAGTGEGRRDDASGGSRDLRDLRRSGAQTSVTNAGNYVITPADQIGSGGLKTKYRDNIAAIRLLKQITAENRKATLGEQRVLVRYVGWGGLKAAFNANSKEWAKEFKELKELLTEEEYKAARRSVLDAHYTSETVITKGIYAAMQRFGLSGGKFVEGGVGVGHFIGLMPESMRGSSSYLGIEKDPTTAKIAQLLYPEARILNQGFEDSKLARGSFDASVGNPPFGEIKLYDKNFKEESKHSIHNFFILKQLELLRPGGVAGFVVSRYFLDSQSSAAREAVAEKAQFLGAIRLPNTAFKQNANTEVTTDIVFFRRLAEGEKSQENEWTKVGEMKDAKTGKPIPVNSWLVAHPDMMLGEMGLTGSMYSDSEPTLEPRPNQDLGADLTAAVQNLPENVFQASDAAGRRLSEPNPHAKGGVPTDVKVGAYFLDETGALRVRTADMNEERQSALVTDQKDATVERIKAMLPIRDALNRLIKAEFDPQSTDERLAALRKTLNRVYDKFVEEFGYLNKPVNRRAFYDDPEAARLLGLESSFDPGVSADVAKKRGIEARPATAQKAAIFTKRVNAPYTEVTAVETAKEALAVSLNQRGEVDLDYMAELSGKDPKALVDELGELIFNNPRGGWQSREQYLSGNVRQKLAEAKAALEQSGDSQWQRNIDALTAVIPADIPATDISAPVGAPWIPEGDVIQFAREVTARAPEAVVYRKSDGGWLFEHHDRSVASTQTFGTERAPFGTIFKDMLNGRPTLIYDKDPDDKPVLNTQETALAAAKAEAVKAKWEEWIWQDQERRERLARVYNDNFNNYVDPRYDGSHLTLPGANPAVELRQHQKNVIWRTITDRRALYDHVVGAGKTFAGIGAFMELRRMGRVRKPLFVVPNHLTEQWKDEFLKLYPSANVLATRADDFTKDNRRKLFGKILTGEFDAVIVGHSQFKKIGVSPEVEKGLLNEMVAEISEAIEAMKKAEGKRRTNSRPVAQAEKTKERLEARLKRLAEVGTRDDVATFEELGIDGLFVDEAHEFKNLFYTTQMQRVAGLGNAKGSQRAFDLYLKTRYLTQRFGGKAPLVFATGTPISNSLVEMFTMQRYLQGEVLQEMGLKSLDAWAKVFGEISHVYEVDPTGTGYRMATRLANFQNVGELTSLYRTVADVITMSDLQAQAEAKGERFPVPRVKGGKPTNYVADRTSEQESYFGVERQDVDEAGNPKFDAEGNPVVSYPPGTILYRVDNMPSDPRIDNMLKLTNDARKAGLDMRLIDPSMPDRPESKVNKAVGEIVKIHRDWAADRGTQLVFCDLSVPASARGKATQKAREEADKFLFRNLAGPGEAPRLVPVEGKPVTIEGFERFKLFAYKTERGIWTIIEQKTGKSFGISESSKKAAVEKATEMLGRLAAQLDKVVATQAVPEEIVAEARGEWMAQQEANEAADTDEEAESEQGVSVDELLADQSSFSVYDDMKAKLIAAGIPEKEIAFIHDYDTPDKKQKLFKAMNRGEVRVLFGSTPKLGAGTNVQQRLVALHHLDAPWRPSDLEQREGRIVRQGNELYKRDPEGFEVTINRYATKQTYDTRMWQILEHKARGIEGFRKADRSTRKVSDVSGEAANASDMKAAASGDPLIQREIELRNERQKLELLKRAWTNNQFELQGRAKWLRDAEVRHKTAVDLANERISVRQAKPDPFVFTKVDGTTHEGREGMAGIVAERVKDAMSVENKKGDSDIGVYRGFLFSVQRQPNGFSIFAKPASGAGHWANVTTYTSDDTISDTGFVQRLDNWLDGFDIAITNADAALNGEKRQLAEIEAELAKPFAKENELSKVRDEHEKTRQELINKRAKKVAPANPEQPGPVGTPSVFEVDPAAPNSQQWQDVTDEQGDAKDAEQLRRFESLLNDDFRKAGQPTVRLTQQVQQDTRARPDDARGEGRVPSFDRSTRALSAALGKRIIFYRSSSPIGVVGITSPELANTILVNTAAEQPMHVIVGHELAHNMAAQRADLFDKLSTAIDEVAPMPREFGMRKLNEGYSADDIRTEWIGDVLGERMDEPEFWQELARASGESGGNAKAVGTMRQLAIYMQEWFRRMGRRFKNLFSDTHRFARDLGELQTRVAEITAQYIGQGPYPDNPGGIRAGGADVELATASPSREPELQGTPAVKGTARQEEVIEKVTGTLEDKRTFSQKVTDYLADLGDYIRFELQQKVLDRFTAIKRFEKATFGTNDLDASVSPYKWARLTNNLAGVMEYLFRHGQIAYQGGSMVMKPGTKGLIEILRPVVESGKLRLWEGYVAAYRANRLLAEGKEKNFGKYQDPATGEWKWDQARAQSEIDALLELGKDHPEFETVRQEYVEFQKSVLDMAQAAGLIDPAKRALWERSDYVPFYRIVDALDGKESRGPRRRRGFSGQSAGVRQLKGGPQQVAILENIVRNVEQMVDASFKNIAMQRIADMTETNTDLMVKIPYKAVPFKASFDETVDAMEKAGIDTSSLTRPEIEELVTFWRSRAPEGKDVVMVMHKGKPVYYRVKDAPLLRAILTMGPQQYSWWMTLLTAPKRGLTSLVTLDPAFMAANTIRDSFSAWVIADTPIKPGWDSMRGFAKALANDPVKLAIMATGGGTGHYNNPRTEEVRKAFLAMTREERQGFLASIVDTPAKAWRLYKDIGRATENANRVAIAESAAKRGASPAEAAFQALDIMDFGLRGDSKALALFLDTVPFLNARIQGLYRLGRGLKNDPKRVATHGAIILGATLALLAANWDDDRYWDLPEWDRDLYYHLWIGGRHIRIPKPFEVGQIFSTLPERMTQFMAKDGDSRLFARRMLSMISDTFAMNPIPQLFKPAVERAMNYNMLTSSRIISRGDEFRAPEEQYNAFTSATAREIAQAMPDRAPEWMRSPKTLDFLIRGYFGTLGMYALDAADAVVRTAADYPERPATKFGDYWIARRFTPESDLKNNKFVGEFYELHQDIGEIARKIKALAERGDVLEASQLAAENADLLGYAPVANATDKALASMRRRTTDLYENPAGLTPEQRRQALAELQEQENELAKRTVQGAPRRPQPIFNPFR